MSLSVAINGMGRIGRLIVRRAFDQKNSSFQVRAINCLYPAATVAHLLKYDTIHGRWNASIRVENDFLYINGQQVQVVAESDPAQLPWKQLGIDIAIDATGKFVDRQGASKHIEAGAKKVIVTAPGKELDLTIVMGVNDDVYSDTEHQLVSAASCTTNCLAPVLHILDQAFGVSSGMMTTIHSYTSDQKVLDNPHKDLRRARACAQSMVPTSTGVGKALVDILPHLASAIKGISVRVPTPDVSLVDLTAQLHTDVTVEEVRQAFHNAINLYAEPYVEWCDEPLVSSDFVGNDKSSVIDGLSVMTFGNQVKLLAWYDNEWGYASRVVDLTRLIAEQAAVPHIAVEAVGFK